MDSMRNDKIETVRNIILTLVLALMTVGVIRTIIELL
jgi:hypothetical protein